MIMAVVSPIEGVYIISVKLMTKHPPTHVATGWTGTQAKTLVYRINKYS